MKKTLVSALTTALVVGAASTTFAAANLFSDVPADHWAYDAVSQLAADGVIEVKVRKTGEVYNFTRADYLEKVQGLLKDL